MVPLLSLIVYILCFGVIFTLLLLTNARFGEPGARVKVLWLAPIVVLPIALYFCISTVPLTPWTLGASALSLIIGVVLERAHLRSARIWADVPHRTLRVERSARLILLAQLGLDTLCYTTLLMLLLGSIPALHTSLFRQFAPELALFSLGSRVTRSWMLSRAWKLAYRKHATQPAETLPV